MFSWGGSMAETLFARFGTVARSWDEPFVLLNSKFCLGSWNAAAEALLGYPATETRGRHASLLFDSAGSSRLQAGFARLRAGGSAERVVAFVCTKNGNRFKSTLTISPVHDVAGHFVGASLAIHRTSGNSTSSSEAARFSAVFDGPDGDSHRHSTRAVLVTWNGAAERLFGYPDFEAAGSRVSMLVAPENDSRFRRELARILTGNQVDNCTCLQLDKSGKLVEAPFSLTPIRGRGLVIGFTAVAQAPAAAESNHNGATGRSRPRDAGSQNPVTETMSQLLQATSPGQFRTPAGGKTFSHWRRVFDQSSIPTAVVSIERRPLWVNSAYTRLVGYSRDEMTRLQSFLDITHADDVAQEEELFRELLAGSRTTYDREKRYVRADGRVVPVRAFTGAIRDESGTIVALLSQAIDLTEQKRAEAQEKSMQGLLREAFMKSPIATAILAPDRHPLWVNDACTQLFGYSRRKLLKLRAFADIIDPEDAAPDNAIAAEIFAGTRQEAEREVRFLHADGHIIPVRLIIAAIRDESGAVISLFAQGVDLTEEKRAQEERRHATRFAHVLFEQSAVAAGAIDTQGMVIAVNDALVRLSGYSRKQLLGSAFVDHIGPDDHGSVTQSLADYISGTLDRGEAEIGFIHADGRRVPTRMYVSVLRDDFGVVVGVIGQIIDLSEQKRIAAEREEQARLRELLLEQSPIPGVIIDPRGNLVLINEATRRLFGRSTVDAIGSTFLDDVHPDDLDRLTQGMTRYRDGTQDTDDAEVHIRHSDGHYVPCRLVTSAVRDDTGALVGIIGQALDLTEQKRVEAQREAEARFRALLFDQSFIPSAAVDPQGRLSSVNEATCRLFGRTREELVGTPIAEHIHPDDRESQTRGMAEYLRGGRNSNKLELRFRHGGGHFVPCQVFTSAMRNEAGSFVGVIGQVLDLTEQKRVEAEREAEARFRELLLDQSPISAVVTDQGGRVLMVNDAICRLLGRSREELVGMPSASMVTPEDATPVGSLLTELLAGTAKFSEIRVSFLHADGHPIPTRLFYEPLRDDSGSIIGVIQQVLDISEQQRAERERELEARYRLQLFEQSHIPAATLDLEGRVQIINDAFLEVFGLSREELVGARLSEHMQPGDVERQKQVFADILAGAAETWTQERSYIHADGHLVHGRVFISTIHDDSGKVVGILGQFLDESELRRMEEQLSFEELHDSLTSLPGRALVADRIGQEIQWARARHRFVGVMVLDVDRFDAMNETFGRALGDQLLVELGQRLVESSLHTDTVGRLESDTFVVVRGAVAHPAEMTSFADNVQSALERPVVLDGEEVVVAVSIGIALGSRDESPERLMRDAELAVVEAKASGGDCAVLFDESLRGSVLARANAEAGLRRALAESEFVLYYQPILDVTHDRFIGVEALIRWMDPTRGLVCPDEFIPIAEETGLIVPIGEWVTGEAFRQVSAWNKERPDAPWEIAINVSPRQIQAGSFLEMMRRALDSSGINPRLVTLEITETTFMENLELVHESLDPLHKLGVRVAIDDFGTGYSSLGRIRRFGIDILKIDRSFVSGLENDEEVQRLTTAILEMGRALESTVIAEGVETAGQLAWLKRAGCSCIQGFLFAKPLPAAECLAVLTRDLAH